MMGQSKSLHPQEGKKNTHTCTTPVSTLKEAACSAQSELFFRILLKNTVRRTHRAAYPKIFLNELGE